MEESKGKSDPLLEGANFLLYGIASVLPAVEAYEHHGLCIDMTKKCQNSCVKCATRHEEKKDCQNDKCTLMRYVSTISE